MTEIKVPPPGHQVTDGPYWPQPPVSSDSGGVEALPPDLLEQVRGRVRLLAGVLFLAFIFDPVLYFGAWVIATFSGIPVDPDYLSRAYLQFPGLGAAIASAALWWLARSGRLSPTRLYTLGHLYEMVIAFLVAWVGNLDHYREFKHLPDLTWAPVIIILFALLLPGTPRRVLGVACMAALMSLLAIALLQATGVVVATADNYAATIIHSGFAILFAYLAAGVIYRLGREVAKAREMGSYQLGDLLGRGGMGEVYRATHRMLARPAAIKLIRPEMLRSDPTGQQMAITRFRREAEAAASLRSPHSVELYDFGVTPDNTFYCVMELLDGTDLETLVRQKGPLPPARVIYLLRQVCESLEEAHAMGLVHRDIKPANIHLGRLGRRHDFVKVLDFGLVKSIDANKSQDSMATAQGNVAGTPSYMAPEVAMGESFDGKADIYAVGCVGYFLLTGRQVFEAANPMAMIVRHMRDVPEAPSQYSELNIPAALDQLILSCLAKHPAERPSAIELSQSLGTVVTEGWGEPEAQQWWTTHRPG